MVFSSKYGANIQKRKTTKSYVFKGIQKYYPLFLSCIKINIGTGTNCLLWFDTWLDKPLRNKVFSPLPKGEEDKKVNSIISKISNNYHWDINDLPLQLPQDNSSNKIHSSCSI